MIGLLAPCEPRSAGARPREANGQTNLRMPCRASNGSEHAALYMREPEDIAEDDDLRFELRYKNADE